jgi:transcription factor 1
MEPEYKNYAPYLGPLLQKKDSTYKLLPLSGILWDNLKKVESEGYLPHQKLREFGDPMLDKPNDTLLVTVNLGFYPRKQYIGFVSVASLVVHQLLSASRAHSIFQGYGQIRMLIWMHDFEKRMVLPRLLPLRSKSSLEAEISCKYIHEIAGSDQEEETYRREHELDRISMQRTAAKMAADGLVTPPHRMTRLEREINEEAKHNASHGGGIRRPYLDELEDLTGRLERKEVALSHDKQGNAQYYEGSTSRRKPGHQATKEWLRFLALTYRLTTENKSFDLLDAKMSEYEKLQTQWTELKKSTAGEKEQRMTEIEDAIVAWRKDVEMQPYRVQKDIMWRLEERRCAHNEPPALMWDRRTAEPLVARAEEFAPAQTMALLDIQPRTIWPVLQGEGLSNYDFFEFMLTVMFSVSKQSVREGLKTLAPGADEWIMPRCPSLTDTENGGVVNPDLLSVRSLTERQWREIFECFMAWPFRPTRGQLLSRVGSQDLHIDEEDNDYTMNA